MNHPVYTTRQLSRRLDACGIDLVGTDSLIQCKAGYENRRPRYEEIYEYIKDRLAESFKADHIINQYPIILIHNIDVGSGKKRQPHHTTVTMTFEDYIRFRSGNVLPILEVL